MAHWKFFNEQDIIDVISPGYASTKEDVNSSREFLLDWKLRPRIPKDLIQPHFLHSNEDEKRFHFLKEAIYSEDSSAIWCLRGGYGSNRLLPMLAKLKRPKKVKLIIGLSDVTSLHTFFNQEWNWPTLHAPILDRMGRKVSSKRDERELHDLLFGKTNEITFKKLRPLNAAAREVTTIKSKIVGGNLAVLQGGMGTPWQINANKSILFLEDIGERGYKVDRMLEQFRQGGVFKKCDGIILGDFLNAPEPSTGKDNFKEVFKRWALDLDIPMFDGIESGHGLVQRPLPFNTPCELKLDSRFAHLTIKSQGH